MKQSMRELEKAREAYGYLCDKSKEFCVYDIAQKVTLNSSFFYWSGSSRPEQHHYGKHGLIIHTAEVAKLCLENNKLIEGKIEDRLLFLAALFHDYGKIWDYQPVGSDWKDWTSSDHKRQIHHISRSAIEWNKATIYQLASDEVDAVTHAILAHHGQRVWGSPVAPKTKMAWMLHMCDGISARMNDCDTWDPYSGKK